MMKKLSGIILLSTLMILSTFSFGGVMGVVYAEDNVDGGYIECGYYKYNRKYVDTNKTEYSAYQFLGDGTYNEADKSFVPKEEFDLHGLDKITGGELIGENLSLNAGKTITSVSKAEIIGKSVQYSKTVTGSVSHSGSTVTLNRSATSDLKLGNTYVLAITTPSGVINISFMYVTKAVRNANDTKFFNLSEHVKVTEAVSSGSSETQTIVDYGNKITGYYVLANDISLTTAESNVHPVVFSIEETRYDFTSDAGFAGTFNGLGHTLTFTAGWGGFFGVLNYDALVQNVGFIDIVHHQKQNLPAIVSAAVCTANDNGKHPTLDNIYVNAAVSKEFGGLIRRGSPDIRLTNIIIDVPDMPGSDLDSRNTTIQGCGGIFGVCYTWFSKQSLAPSEEFFHDIYLLADTPVYYYRWTAFDSKGYGYCASGGYYGYGWIQGYAGNEGVTQNLMEGRHVLNGIKKYSGYGELAKSDNTYGGFNEYWDKTTYGAPVWKECIKNDSIVQICLLSEGYKTSSAIYLELGGIETARVWLGLRDLPLSDAQDMQITFTSGEQYISIDNNGYIRALAEGTTKFKVAFTLNGKTYSKDVKVIIWEALDQPEDPPKEEEPTKGSGCGTVTFDINSFGGGMMIVLGATCYMIIRKKKLKEN